MNKLSLRLKNNKKAVTPVIATIILIAATLVLALVVGAYTFGLFGSNVKTVTLISGTLYSGSVTISTVAGTSSMQISVNNPGSTTCITSLTLTGSQLSASITTYAKTGTTASLAFQTSSCTAATAGYDLASPGTTSLTLLPFATAAASIPSGATVSYVINFMNGQSISGVFTAQ